MKLAYVLIGATVTAGFAAMAAATPTVPATPAVPAWSCNTQDVAIYKKVNECRRQCAEGKETRRQSCIDTMRTCRAGCADDACKTKCLDDGNKCVKDNYAAVDKCADACVTSNGCTL